MIPETVGLRISTLRRIRQLSQGELADLTTLSRSSVDRIEKNDDGKLSMIIEIAHALKVNPACLIHEPLSETSDDPLIQLIESEQRVIWM